MGDPGKIRKKYRGPSHPWEKTRIDQEKIIKEGYGLKNKKEIWKYTSKIVNLNTKTKKIIAERTFKEQAKKEEKQILEKLQRMGILNADSKIEDVLSLNINKFLERRLQTVVYKKGFAKSIKQARQFITHGHISLNGRSITIPSYNVTTADENNLIFSENSALKNLEHPERAAEKKVKEIENREAKEIKVTEEIQELVAEELAQAQIEEAKIDTAK